MIAKRLPCFAMRHHFVAMVGKRVFRVRCSDSHPATFASYCVILPDIFLVFYIAFYARNTIDDLQGGHLPLPDKLARAPE